MVESNAVTFVALGGLPEIEPGADLAALILAALRAQAVRLGDPAVIVVAQKIVSKAEGRFVELAGVAPSAEAQRLAQVTGKDPRLVEVVLAESEEVVRAAPHVLIVRHRLGFVVANAGVDRSNVPRAGAGERVLLLPRDPDASAAALRANLAHALGAKVAVIITDSFGRPWRRGVTHVALGCAGLPSLVDRRGECDREGRALEVTEVALADAIACGAGLVMGEAAESTPVVVAQGLRWSASERPGAALLRPKQEDLFR
ncbi:MAG TPA: coenzyme F420-0:L-glutamate ligase [Steroidobacteraceae bacterium]|nr:coenzyme F420-0:L-glutamate ligase [Steroidobacteraceae bacterium]